MFSSHLLAGSPAAGVATVATTTATEAALLGSVDADAATVEAGKIGC